MDAKMLKKDSLLAVAALVLINCALALAFLNNPDGRLHLKVYDVGQGDSIFIKTPSGQKILVDGGPDNKVLEHLGRELPFWDRKIDFVLLTHPQADHMTGLVETIKRYQIGTVLVSGVENTTNIYKQWKLNLAKEKIIPKIVKAGDKIEFGDKTKVTFIWPQELNPTVSDLNAACLVFKLSYGSFDAYLTGDADAQVQPYSQSEQIEVLKVPHHGSKAALREDYLAKLKPSVSIISVGKNNRYGHPNSGLISLLTKYRSKIYRTDQDGSVEVVSDGKNWYTKAEKGT